MDKDFDSEEEYGREDDGESSEGEMDDGRMSSSEDESVSEKEAENQSVDEFAGIKPVPDHYWMDAFLVRREATLL